MAVVPSSFGNMLRSHNADGDEVRTSVASVVSSSSGTRIFPWFVGLAALLIAPTGRTETLVVIVNPSVGVQQLSRREALDIFLGRYRTFPSGASALPIDLDINSEERKEFYLVLAHKDPPDMNSYWARVTFTGKISPPFAVATARMAVELVANNVNAIAYVDPSAVDNRVRIALQITPLHVP